MRYLCIGCNYIYDEDLGDKNEGIKPGTKFDKLGDKFICPVCGEYSDMFQEIKEEINYLGNEPKDILEREHFIVVENLGNYDIRISIGFDEYHPSGDEHRVTSIGIYDEYGDLIYEEFFNSGEEPVLEYNISDFDEYEVRARCSIHGLWGLKIN